MLLIFSANAYSIHYAASALQAARLVCRAALKVGAGRAHLSARRSRAEIPGLQVTFRSAPGSSLRRLVRAGDLDRAFTRVPSALQIKVLPAVTVQREIAQGDLARIDWGGRRFDVITQLVRHAKRWQSAGQQAFLTIAREVLAAR